MNALVLVHRRQLLDQWLERLSNFFHLPAKSIGRLGGGRSRPTGHLDVALIQSLARKGVVDDRVGEYGHLIVDECHHLSAHSFERVPRLAKARFVTGLSATIARKDGHHPIIFMQCGPVRYRVNAKAQAAIRPFEHVVLVQPTAFHPLRPPESDKRLEFQTLYQELIDDEPRHRRICDDVIQAVQVFVPFRGHQRRAAVFVHVARTVPPDAERADRARSASEAFLYRRLQTVPGTRERFRLNASLPIAFDGTGALEVDLLCDGARVAVELDGAQHLSDPAAYRRDRRKDQLLQENGYLVLRFLAEDVGKELELVLDSIIRAVNHRGSAISSGSIIAIPAVLRMAGHRYAVDEREVRHGPPDASGRD